MASTLSPTSPTVEPPRVVIVGGGYGGVAAARNTSASMQVTLVTQSPLFFHTVEAVQLVVNPAWEDNVLHTMTDLVPPHVKVVVASVNKVDLAAKRVLATALVTDEPEAEEHSVAIPFDYVVIATGRAGSAFPGRVPASLLPDRRAIVGLYDKLRLAIERATNVVLVGGGPVGTELAGAIAEKYGLSKSVTLVNRGPELLGNFTPPLSSTAKRKMKSSLERLGCRVIVGDTIDLSTLDARDAPVVNGSALFYQPPKKTVRTTSARDIDADVVIVAIGKQPSKEQAPVIPVLPTLQVRKSTSKTASHPLLAGDLDLSTPVDAVPFAFAIGDITDVHETKQAYRAALHADVAIKNIKLLSSGKETPQLAQYHPAPTQMLASLGLRTSVLVADVLFGLLPIAMRVPSVVNSAIIFVRNVKMSFIWGIKCE